MVDCGGGPDNGGLCPRINFWDASNVDLSRLQAVFLTHGHLDHMGGLGDLAETLAPSSRKIVLRGSSFSLSCASNRFEDSVLDPHCGPMPNDYEMVMKHWSISTEFTAQVGRFLVSPIKVDHSIPGAYGYLIKWNNTNGDSQRIIHLGDFKLADEWEEYSQYLSLRRSDILLLDSSGATSEGRTPDEAEGLTNLQRILDEHPNQPIIVAGFSTNVVRWEALRQMGARQGREVFFVGSSLWSMMAIARAQGLAQECEVSASFSRNRLVITTGCQAEENSGLWKMAQGSHPEYYIAPNAVVVIAARIIPGRERQVAAMISQIQQRLDSSCGGKVIVNHNAPETLTGVERRVVSPSGHCSENDLDEVIRTLQPKCVIPIHGDWERRNALAEIARSLGYEAQLLGDGQSLDLAT